MRELYGVPELVKEELPQVAAPLHRLGQLHHRGGAELRPVQPDRADEVEARQQGPQAARLQHLNQTFSSQDKLNQDPDVLLANYNYGQHYLTGDGCAANLVPEREFQQVVVRLQSTHEMVDYYQIQG